MKHETLFIRFLSFFFFIFFLLAILPVWMSVSDCRDSRCASTAAHNDAHFRQSERVRNVKSIHWNFPILMVASNYKISRSSYSLAKDLEMFPK